MNLYIEASHPSFLRSSGTSISTDQGDFEGKRLEE
jgi:hypothetical protein